MKKNLLSFFLLFLFFSVQGQEKFTHDVNASHYLVILPVPGWTDMPDMVEGLAKYNYKYYKEEQFAIKQYKMTKEDKLPFVLMSEFENEKEAIVFYQKIRKTPPDFLHMGLSLDFFVISRKNYNKSIRSRSFTDYRNYFKERYPY